MARPRHLALLLLFATGCQAYDRDLYQRLTTQGGQDGSVNDAPDALLDAPAFDAPAADASMDTATPDVPPEAAPPVDAPPDGPVVPPTITSSSAFWLRADTLMTRFTDGQSVPSWRDQGAQHLDVSQSTPSKQPAFHTSDPGIGGLPYVTFSGSQCLLSAVNAGSYTDFTLFAVFRYTTNITGFGTLFGPAWDTAFALRLDNTSGVEAWVLGSEGTILAPLSLGSWYLFATTRSGGVDTAWSSGSALLTTTTTMGATANALMSVGCEASGSFNLTGDLAEVMAFQSALSTSDRSAVECYLGAKYGFAISHGCS